MTASNLEALIERELGTKVTHRDNPLISSVGTTATRLLRLNAARVAFLLVNLSTVNLYVGWFPNVATSRAIILGAGGGSLRVWYKEDYHLPGLEWFVLADAANSNLFVTEFTLVKAAGGARDAN